MRQGCLVAVVAAVLSGCTLTVNPRYQPGPLPTAWEGRKPKVFLGAFTDKMSAPRVTGTSGASNRVVFARPPEAVLREAFLNQFQRMGVPVVSTLAECDAQISASFKETVLELPAGFAVHDRAAVHLGVAVKSPDNRLIYNDEIIGKGESRSAHPGCCPGSAPAQAVDAALAHAMKTFEDLFIGEIAEQVFLAQKSGAVAQAGPASPSTPRSDVDDVPAGPASPRKGHAVVIGVERYRQQLPNADFAAGDARLVARYLTKSLGFPEQNVAVLTNDGASRGDLEKYLERWLANRVEPGDPVFVYFSGHGSPNPATGDAYLVPYDGDPMYLDQTAYPLRKLYGALAKLPSKNVTVVLDSCFSGTGGRSVIAKGARPLVNARATEVPEELTVLSAAAGNQISQSYQEKGHGLFTYFFLKGLAKQAGKPAWDMKQVFDFAAPEVSRVARQDYNTEQQPQWHGGER